MESWPARIKHRCPAWVTVLLLFPWVYLLWMITGELFLIQSTSGALLYEFLDIFRKPFNYSLHGGWAMDQPTIGKFLIWFVITTFFSAPLIWAARWITDRSTKLYLGLFAVPVLFIGLLLLCLLNPATLLFTHYVYWMGFTLKRFVGVFFFIAAWILWPLFIYRMVRKPRPDTSCNPS